MKTNNLALDPQLSNAFRYAAFIATILVVAIHYNTKNFISLSNGYTVNYYIQEFITNGVARVAVPFFALASGFFYFIKYNELKDYKRLIKSRVRSLLIPYALVSLFIYITEVIYADYKGNLFEITLYLVLKDVLIIPISVQFWFLRDLMILVMVAPLLFVFAKKMKLTFLLVLFFLWYFDIEFMPSVEGWHLLSIETLFFFVLGGYLSKKNMDFLKLVSSPNNIYLIIIVYLAIILLRVFLYPDFLDGYIDKYNFQGLILQKTHILIGVYLLLLFSYKINNNKILYLSNFVFFVYLFHVYPLSRLINKITDFFIIDQYKFYVNFLLANFMCFLIAIVLKSILPTVYKYISGNR